MPFGYESFVAGFAYGLTTVLVGQPLDTIKTRMQALGYSSARQTGVEIFRSEGVRGLYRGGAPLIIGGGLMRSAQFGVNEAALSQLHAHFTPTTPAQRWFSFLDPQVVAAGFLGGVGRGLVEGPVEYIKVRRQVHASWKVTEMLNGSGVTIFRNSLLFSGFMIYVDISKQLVPGGLGPFLTGAVCANLAWLTIWPLDVVKTQLQSGKYKGKSPLVLIGDVFRSGLIYRGLLPGLTRSTLANGLSMVVYKKVEAFLKDMSSEETSRS